MISKIGATGIEQITNCPQCTNDNVRAGEICEHAAYGDNGVKCTGTPCKVHDFDLILGILWCIALTGLGYCLVIGIAHVMAWFDKITYGI
jgi:hypothetical protein